MQTVLASTMLLVGLMASPPSGWQVAASIPGVFDVAGPRADGKLVVAGSQGLWLLDPHTGTTARFAPAYSATGGYEAYIAMVPARPVAGCFKAGDVYALRQAPKGGIARIAVDGTVLQFATVPVVDKLGGIAFDDVGSFGGRLLVFGGYAGKTVVAAIDCRGALNVITTRAPVAEGGAVVAPPHFGYVGGDLVLTDELSGRVFAVNPNGQTTQIATPPLDHGGDIGVEGAGFVPPGDGSQDTVYFADRSTPGSPHPGSDYLLATPGTMLAANGVRPGDLLVATEGGAALDAIRCNPSCMTVAVIPANATSHGEGHVLVLGGPAASHAPGTAFGRAPARPTPVAQLVLTGLALAALALLWLRRRLRRSP